jgi:diguanylate cyclase (GGDEF)-like protein
MPDSETPPHQPEGPVPAPGPSVSTSSVMHFGPGPAQAATPAPEPSAAPPALPSEATPPDRSSGRLPFGARGLWLAFALLCVAAGALASVLGSHSLARSDAAKNERAAHQSAAQIATGVRAAIQHEEDLTLTASAFFADHPNASAAEFHAWAKWVKASHRYPELAELRLVTPVSAAGLAGFAARGTPSAAKPTSAAAGSLASSSTGSSTGSPASSSTGSSGSPLASSSASAALRALHIIPPGERALYCLALAGLARSAVKHLPAGTDYCVRTPGLVALRDSGASRYAGTSISGTRALRIETPVYRGGVVPGSLAGRRAAFVGWLHQVLEPGAVLSHVLAGHPGSAARLRHRAGSSKVTFTSGTPAGGAQSTTTNLQGGWSLKSFLPLGATGVAADGRALGLLIGGCLLSVLLGLLIALLGLARGGRPAVRPVEETPIEDLYDPLTGLPNRPLTLDLAERMLARTGRQSGMLGGALIVDVDWFKDVNEKLGEAAGDEILTTVAKRLERVVRDQDTVGRLAGDRFVILVESAARGVRLDSLARRVIEAMHEPMVIANFGPSFFVTASIGVAYGRYVDPAELLRDSELALDAAKAAGKDGYTLFNANMRSLIESQAVLEGELNTGLQERQFFLLYQPICELDTRAIVGFEALIRWQHPTQGILTPTDFLPAAEETGLIVPIGRWVLEEACARAASWNVSGHRVGISVMVSPRQMNRDGFVTDVRRALQQSGIEPALLTLEIGESAVMDDVEAATARLSEIKRLGVRIAIDDFGNAYARRSDLQRLPLDFLKVDPSELASSDDEDYRNWLLEAILILGRDLSLSVIAKGIETEEQMARLKVMGCRLAQGYFMGEPTPTSAVEGVLSSRAALARSAGTSLLS